MGCVVGTGTSAARGYFCEGSTLTPPPHKVCTLQYRKSVTARKKRRCRLFKNRVCNYERYTVMGQDGNIKDVCCGVCRVSPNPHLHHCGGCVPSRARETSSKGDKADAAPLAGNGRLAAAGGACSCAFRRCGGEGDAPGRLDQREHRQVLRQSVHRREAPHACKGGYTAMDRVRVRVSGSA